MTGGTRKPDIPPAPDPTPTPILGREIDEAKKKVKGRVGRQQNIFAGRLTAQRGATILNTRLG